MVAPVGFAVKIHFACPNCAKQLVADAAAAGRTGRCRHCGKPAVVPSGYTLRPVTPTKTPTLVGADWDHAELGPAIAFPAGPSRSLVAAAKPMAIAPAANGPAPAPMLVAYRSFFGLLGRLTAWISETSYTVSFVLIILAIAGGMIGRHSLAAWACGAIVSLNLVGLAGDIASLATLSFRKNPLQGALFFVPPCTLYYLWTDWRRYRDTIHRMRLPLVTLAVVAAAYVCVPWLRGGAAEEGRIVASVKQVAARVEEGLAGRQGAIDEGLKKARSWLREVPLPDPSSLPGVPGKQQATPGGRP